MHHMAAVTSVLAVELVVWCVSCAAFSIRAKIRRSDVIYSIKVTSGIMLHLSRLSVSSKVCVI